MFPAQQEACVFHFDFYWLSLIIYHSKICRMTRPVPRALLPKNIWQKPLRMGALYDGLRRARNGQPPQRDGSWKRRRRKNESAHYALGPNIFSVRSSHSINKKITTYLLNHRTVQIFQLSSTSFRLVANWKKSEGKGKMVENPNKIQ